MALQDIDDRIVAVLARAESLFNSATDHAPKAADTLTSAAEASRAITAHTETLSGATASAHADLLAGSDNHLTQAAATEARLHDVLSRAAGAHAEGASQSTGLRLGAEQLPSALEVCGELPAAELAGLLALRSRVADMQQLLVEHSGQAARAADDILSLGYEQ